MSNTITCGQCGQSFDSIGYNRHKACHRDHCYVFMGPRIVGSPEKYEIIYDTNDERYDTLQGAVKGGIRYFGSDDFIVAEISPRTDKNIVYYLYNSDLTRRQECKSEKKRIANFLF